jgi:hypothetical protein
MLAGSWRESGGTVEAGSKHFLPQTIKTGVGGWELNGWSQIRSRLYTVKIKAGFRKATEMGCLRIYGGPVSMVGRVWDRFAVHRLNFERLILERPNFERPNFERPNFEKIQLRRTDLRTTELRKTQFRATELRKGPNFQRLTCEKDWTSKIA